ncbi:MAG: hypothetical protein KDC44_22505, partial [Phaeodactylibacter sp.]|nr:hypothetical protein [Phaeodactylibacter sp.]
ADRPIRRRRLYQIAAAAAAVLVGWLIVSTVMVRPTYESRSAAYFASRPFVEEPLGDVAQAKFAKYTISGSAGGVYEFETGSRLTIPAAAFETHAGAPVDGNIDIYYREMHDFVDFFLSGIPMTYDSAGVTYSLESAGMIEIYAEQNGQRIRMRPGKTIDVELISEINAQELNVPPQYNIYRLDTVARKWVYQNVDQIQITETALNDFDPNHPLYTQQQSLQQQLDALRLAETDALDQLAVNYPAPTEPLRPERPDGSNFVFDFDLSDYGSNINIPYASSLWQVRRGQGIGEAELNKNWEDLQLLQLNSRDYELNLINGDEILTVIVNPVLSGPDYQRAMSTYEAALEKYRQEMTIWEQIVSDTRDSVRNSYAEQRNQLESSFFEQLAKVDTQAQPKVNQSPFVRHKIINRFKANKLGIWNCDRPLPPEMVQLNAQFKDPAGNVLTQCTGYLVDRHKNTVLQFLVDEETKLRFNANAQNLLWVVTPDGQIGILRAEAFKTLRPNARRRQTLDLTYLNQAPQDEAGIRELLYF